MVSYRTGPLLTAAIDAVLAPDQAGVVELILVDNGNPPAVTAALARRAEAEPRLTLVTGHGNVGFARGCNIGAGAARGRYLLLLNPDCLLRPGAAPTLLAEAASLGGDWLLGGRLLNPDGSEQRGARRALLTPRTALTEVLRLDRLAPRRAGPHRLNHPDRPLPAGTTRVPAVSGACMLLPAATFRAVGGLDEGYFMHVEDLDLCLRLDRAGTPIYFAPHVEAVHHAGSSRVDPIRVEWHKTRGFLRYFRLHFRSLSRLPAAGLASAGALARFGVKVLHSLLARRPARGPESGSERMTATAGGRVGGRPFAVVLGATSLVGRHLARRLADAGFDGVCLTRRPAPPPYDPPPGFSWRVAPTAEGVTAPAAATWFSLVPILALPALVRRAAAGRVIALSTSSVRFKARSSDPRERETAQRLERAEADLRQLCEDREAAWTIFRPTLIYDPGHDRNVTAIASFVRRFGFFPIVRPGVGGRQPIHADDVARAMVAAAAAPGARNARLDLPGGETLSYRDMVRRIFESLGRRPFFVPLPLGPARTAFHLWRLLTGAPYSVASLERMNAPLTLDPAPAQEILGLTCRRFHPEFPGDLRRTARRGPPAAGSS